MLRRLKKDDEGLQRKGRNQNNITLAESRGEGEDKELKYMTRRKALLIMLANGDVKIYKEIGSKEMWKVHDMEMKAKMLGPLVCWLAAGR